MDDWHVVAVEPSAERLVSRRAQEVGIEAFVPTGTRLVRRRTKHGVEMEPRTTPAIPGYVFVRGGRADQYRRDREHQDTVNHCLGVLGVDGPEPVPPAVVEELRERQRRGEFDTALRSGRHYIPHWLKGGRSVRVMEGPLRGVVARVWRVMMPRRSVALWVLVMGRETLAEVPVEWVARSR